MLYKFQPKMQNGINHTNVIYLLKREEHAHSHADTHKHTFKKKYPEEM